MRRTAAGLTALLALTVASCSLPGTGSKPDTPASDPPASVPASVSASPTASAEASGFASEVPTPSAAPSGSASAAPTPAEENQPSAGDQLGQVVATRTSAMGKAKVMLNLYAVVRDQTTSHLNYTLTSGSAGSTEFVTVGQTLSDGNGKTGDAGPWAADGLQLIDGKNAKLYLVASDGQGQCVCSRELLNVSLRGGAPVLFSATFAAPPAGVTSVSVRIPNFGTVKNVPVQ